MFVRRAIDHYLKGKRSRRDVTRFLETHPDLDRLAERIADEIREGRYRDTRITYFNRVEPISGKHRVIGRESVRHQIYDHVPSWPSSHCSTRRWDDGRPPASPIAAPSTPAARSNDGHANDPANGS